MATTELTEVVVTDDAVETKSRDDFMDGQKSALIESTKWDEEEYVAQITEKPAVSFAF
jgi:hypothetical protein